MLPLQRLRASRGYSAQQNLPKTEIGAEQPKMTGLLQWRGDHADLNPMLSGDVAKSSRKLPFFGFLSISEFRSFPLPPSNLGQVEIQIIGLSRLQFLLFINNVNS